MSSSRRPSAFPFRLTTLGAAVASIMLAANAQAVALGKLKVLTALGQPLQAEIELISTVPEEAGSLEAKVASFDTFRQTGIEYNPVLSSLRFAIDQRGGRRVIRVTSPQPVNEPFVDLLLELRSNDGRLVREYLFLLDPPGTGDAATAPVAAASASAPPAAARQPSSASAGQPENSRPVQAAPAKPARPPAAQHHPAQDTRAERLARSKPAASPGGPRLALTDISVSPGSASFTPEERTVMEKTVTEANERVRMLEQKVDALQKLLVATNNVLAELRKHNDMVKVPADIAPPATAAASASAASAAAAATPAAPTIAPATVQAPPTASPAAGVPDAKPQESVSATAVAAAPPPVRKPAASVPAKPRPAPPPADTGLLDNLFTLSVGGLSLLLFGAAGAYLMRRRRQQKPADTTTLYVEEGTAPDTAPAPTMSRDADAEQSVFIPGYADTAALPGLGDDPVAEADVYIAYGRDGQAEQILKDALQKQPERHAVRLKLLSIYASRKDRESFDQLARDLHAMTGGQGEEWSHAAALGTVIDPDNGLYAAHSREPEAQVAMPGVPVPDLPPATSPGEPAEDADRSVPSFDFTHDDAPSAELATSAPALPLLDMAPTPVAESAAIDLDFALDMPSVPAEQAPTPGLVAEERQPGPGPIDFDLGLEMAPTMEPALEQRNEAVSSGPGPIEFELPELPLAAPEALVTDSAPQAGTPSESGPGPIDFDFELPEIPALAQLEESASESQPAAGTNRTNTETTLDFDSMLADLLPPEKKPE
ncbi:MAG TPA: hypothetical protein VF450_06175 [Noviherbaspirillum sp.]